MKTQYVPQACKGKNPKFSGSVTLRIPSFDERYRYMEECNFSLADDGALEANIKQLPAVRKMVALSGSHYETVALKTKDGKEFKTFEDMTLDPICDNILVEVAGLLLNGLRPGNA